MTAPRPVPGDPSSATVESMFDLNANDWMLTTGGDYQTAAGEVMKADGSNWQRVVMLEWPARRNHDHSQDGDTTVRLLISPEDAIGLAEVLRHTGEWLAAANIVTPPES